MQPQLLKEALSLLMLCMPIAAIAGHIFPIIQKWQDSHFFVSVFS